MSTVSTLLLIAALRIYPILLVHAIVTHIDNTDPRIQYNGSWSLLGWVGASQSPYYRGTLSYTNTTGTVIRISVEACLISVYGALVPSGSFKRASTYILDGETKGTFSSSQNNVEIPNMPFWTSGPIPCGTHTLDIENQGEELYLDYLDVGLPDTTTLLESFMTTPIFGTAIASSDVSATAAPSNPSSDASTLPPSNSRASMPSPEGSNGASTPTQTVVANTNRALGKDAGLIAGVVIGGIAVLLIAIFVVIRVRHSMRGRAVRRVSPMSQKAAIESDLHLDGATTRASWALPIVPFPSQPLSHLDARSMEPPSSLAASTAASDDIQETLVPTPIQEASCSHPERAIRHKSSNSPRRMVPSFTLAREPPNVHVIPAPRRSLDGGIRVAGGPLTRQADQPGAEGEAGTVASTLPPAYQLYRS